MVPKIEERPRSRSLPAKLEHKEEEDRTPVPGREAISVLLEKNQKVGESKDDSFIMLHSGKCFFGIFQFHLLVGIGR